MRITSCLNTRASVSGVILTLNSGPIEWFSRKQGVVATSTLIAEYIAAFEAAKEIVWTRGILKELGQHQHEPSILYCDNTAAEQLIKNLVFHRRTKHVDIKYRYTSHIMNQGLLTVQRIASEE